MGGVPAAPLDARRTAKAEAEAGCGSFEAAAARIGAAMGGYTAGSSRAPSSSTEERRKPPNGMPWCRVRILDTGSSPEDPCPVETAVDDRAYGVHSPSSKQTLQLRLSGATTRSLAERSQSDGPCMSCVCQGSAPGTNGSPPWPADASWVFFRSRRRCFLDDASQMQEASSGETPAAPCHLSNAGLSRSGGRFFRGSARQRFLPCLCFLSSSFFFGRLFLLPLHRRTDKIHNPSYASNWQCG